MSIHPNTPPIGELEKIKQGLLATKKRTELEEKQLRAVTVQLEDIHSLNAADDVADVND